MKSRYIWKHLYSLVCNYFNFIGFYYPPVYIKLFINLMLWLKYTTLPSNNTTHAFTHCTYSMLNTLQASRSNCSSFSWLCLCLLQESGKCISQQGAAALRCCCSLLRLSRLRTPVLCLPMGAPPESVSHETLPSATWMSQNTLLLFLHFRWYSTMLRAHAHCTGPPM